MHDKNLFDEEAARKKISKALCEPYGWDNGEWGYSLVKPKVMVEQYIESDSPNAPPDYKFHCVNGVVKYLHFIYDRDGDTRELFTDRDGNIQPFVVYFPAGKAEKFSKPLLWDEMVRVAEVLATGFKYVRVDLYLTKSDQIYVGEMTFWPMAGCYKGEGQKTLGMALDFDRTTFKPTIYRRT